jgi:hypothetical protein
VRTHPLVHHFIRLDVVLFDITLFDIRPFKLMLLDIMFPRSLRAPVRRMHDSIAARAVARGRTAVRRGIASAGASDVDSGLAGSSSS